jgi:hypothetical protein
VAILSILVGEAVGNPDNATFAGEVIAFISLLGTIIAFVAGFKHRRTADAEGEEDVELRDKVTDINARLTAIEHARLRDRMARAETEITALKEWHDDVSGRWRRRRRWR